MFVKNGVSSITVQLIEDPSYIIHKPDNPNNPNNPRTSSTPSHHHHHQHHSNNPNNPLVSSSTSHISHTPIYSPIPHKTASTPLKKSSGNGSQKISTQSSIHSVQKLTNTNKNTNIHSPESNKKKRILNNDSPSNPSSPSSPSNISASPSISVKAPKLSDSLPNNLPSSNNTTEAEAVAVSVSPKHKLPNPNNNLTEVSVEKEEQEEKFIENTHVQPLVLLDDSNNPNNPSSPNNPKPVGSLEIGQLQDEIILNNTTGNNTSKSSDVMVVGAQQETSNVVSYN